MDNPLSRTGAPLAAPDIHIHNPKQGPPESAKSPDNVGLEERVSEAREGPEREMHHQIPPDFNDDKPKEETKNGLEELIIKLIKSDFVQKDLSTFSNIASLLGNGFSSFVNAIPAPKVTKQFATAVGSFVTKLALGVNGTIGGFNQLFIKNNPISGLMHMAENLVIAIFPQNEIYNIRGINSGINLTTFGMNQYDDTDQFKNYTDYFSRIVPNLKKAFSEMSPDIVKDVKGDFFIKAGSYISKVVQSMWSKDSGLLTIINGVGMTAGTFISMVPGMKTFGKILRNTTGLVQDFVRLKDFENKKYDFYSGASFLLGSVLNYSLMFLNKSWENIIVPIIFAFDGLARYFFRRSQDLGETVKGKGNTQVNNIDIPSNK